MNRIQAKTVLQIDLRDGFRVIIMPGEGNIDEVWLNHETIGIMELMFGIVNKTATEVVSHALADAEDYIDLYEERYIQED